MEVVSFKEKAEYWEAKGKHARRFRTWNTQYFQKIIKR